MDRPVVVNGQIVVRPVMVVVVLSLLAYVFVNSSHLYIESAPKPHSENNGHRVMRL